MLGFGWTLGEGLYHAFGGNDGQGHDWSEWSERMIISTGITAIATECLIAAGFTGGEVLFTRGAQGRASGYIAALENSPTGSIEVPKGQITSKTMAEISNKTGKEVGLFRTDYGARVLKLGGKGSTNLPAGTTKIIAHTHPSGRMAFSPDDINQLQALKQRSSVLINLEGTTSRLPTE